MTELVTAIGLAASIAQLVEVGMKIVKRIHEFQKQSKEVPEAFRSIVSQIPLLNINLDRISNQSRMGNVSDDVIKALFPVIDETRGHAVKLEILLTNILPPSDARKLEKGIAALKSIAKESEVERAANKIKDCMHLLVLHQTTSDVDLNHKIMQELGRLTVRKPALPSSLVSMNTPQATADMHDAIRNHDLARVRALVASGTMATAYDVNGRTPLHTAAAFNAVHIIEYLVRQRANINAESLEGQTALHIAIINNCLSATRALYVLRAKSTIRDNSGKKPEDYLPEDDIQKLWTRRHGEDISARDLRTGNTVLMYAAAQGNVIACETLLCRGVPIWAKNEQFETALHFACIFDHADTVALLLTNGADPYSLDLENFSPFTRCIWMGHLKATRLILESGKVKADDAGGPKSRDQVLEAARAGNWKMVYLLLDHDLSIEVQSSSGETLLRIAITASSSAETVEHLLKAGADTNPQDFEEYTLMEVVIRRRRWDLARLLLEYQSDEATQSWYGTDPLFCVIVQRKCHDLSLLRLLVKKGADVNAVTVDGWTALHTVCKNGGPSEIVNELLQLGANSQRTNWQRVPWLETTINCSHACCNWRVRTESI